MATASLCFRAAFHAKKNAEITDEEYLHHLIAHFLWIRHPEDECGDWGLSSVDPVGVSIREMALEADNKEYKVWPFSCF